MLHGRSTPRRAAAGHDYRSPATAGGSTACIGAADAGLAEWLRVADSDAAPGIDGMADVATIAQLREVLDAARARAHVLEADLDALRLDPTEADLASMQVDGALADVVVELRALQDDPDQAAIAREALRQLFDILQRTQGEAR